jgi:hypothetical protein
LTIKTRFIRKYIQTEFDVAQVKDSCTLWLNQFEGDYSPVLFAKQFGYIKVDNNCFSEIETNQFETKTLNAEQYGGIGVGENGGGVRCGNDINWQLKGIGVNHLVGEHNDFDHSSGMYPIDEAITETVNAVVYDEILPIGVVKSIGIISIGQSPYIEHLGLQHNLAIGVRECCIRPAHFMAAGNFKPLQKNKDKYLNEAQRVRQINNKLKESFKSNDNFIQFMGRFLSNSANQFAFTFIHRIAHGSVSPSNMTIDGKWLDLTNTTFVPSAINYSASPETASFFVEAQIIVDIIKLWVRNYTHYNGIKFNITPLVNYYFEQLDAYSIYYIPLLFGVSSEIVGASNLDKYKKTLLISYTSVISNQPSDSVVGFPNNDNISQDIIINYVKRLFISTLSQDDDLDEDILALCSLLHYSAKAYNINIKNYTIYCAICSLRKLIFAVLFFVGNIHKMSNKILNAHTPNIQNFIDTYHSTAKWLFDKSEESTFTVLFESDKLQLTLEVESYQYTLIKNDQKIIFQNACELLKGVMVCSENDFQLLGFGCKNRIVLLLKFLILLENK